MKAAAGLRWIAEAFAVFRVGPVRQLLYCLSFLLALAVALSIPAVGFALVWTLIPALIVGPHAIARAASRGVPPEAGLLLAGFRGGFAVASPRNCGSAASIWRAWPPCSPPRHLPTAASSRRP